MTNPNTTPADQSPRPYMTCHEVLDFLMTYIDGELSPEQRFEFDRHLTVCPSCVNYLESYKATIRIGKAALANTDEPATRTVPEDLIRAIRAARLKDA